MKKDNLFGELLAEFIGAFILIFIGAGCVASLVINGQAYNIWDIGLIWGFGVTMAIYITGAVSGTHINPAVTISLAVHRGFPWKKVIPYTIAQVAGCFTGAAATLFLFGKGLQVYEASAGIVRGALSSQATAGIFTTYPQSYLTNVNALFVEIAITAFLLIAIYAIGDAKNGNAPKGKYTPFAPILVGLTIAIIGASFGSLTGFAMNPARDFGPKLFLSLAGWGSVALPAPNNYFWVPIVGPIIGAILGGYIYDLGVSKFIVTAEASSETDEESLKEAS
jgi:glycerol uptake facilitator protein